MTQELEGSAGTDPVAAPMREADIRARALAHLAPRPRGLPRSVRVGAISAIGGLHALVFLMWMASRFALPAPDSPAVQVLLLDAPAPLPRPPEPASLRRPRAMAAAVLPAAVPTPAVAPNASAATGKQPLIFTIDGSIALPPQAPTPLEAGLARGRELLARGHNLIHCRRSTLDNAPTPAQAARNAASSAHMAHLIMGNPLDPLNDAGIEQQYAAAGEMAARKRAIQEQACDD
ncbi:MAG: hypothetical protein JSS28_12885 [Proteobacteria bacterium]|nr:hypothetical protein [Pseudomonadota bacterium]